MLKHAVDGVQQPAHDRAIALQRQLAHADEVLEIRLDLRVMLAGAHGGHVQAL